MSDDYVKASRVEVLILRPKKTTVTFEVPSESIWHQLWDLDHRPARPGWEPPRLKPEDRVATVFKLTLISLPRRTQASDLTLRSALALVHGEIAVAMNDVETSDHTPPQRPGKRGVGFGRPRTD